MAFTNYSWSDKNQFRKRYHVDQISSVEYIPNIGYVLIATVNHGGAIETSITPALIRHSVLPVSTCRVTGVDTVFKIYSEILSSNWQALNRVSVIIRAMFNRALAFWEASRSTTTTSSDRDREMLQNSVRVVTLLGKAKMIPSILASTCEIYQFVSPYELFLLLNAIWGFLHCNPVTQAGFYKMLLNRWRSRANPSIQ